MQQCETLKKLHCAGKRQVEVVHSAKSSRSDLLELWSCEESALLCSVFPPNRRQSTLFLWTDICKEAEACSFANSCCDFFLA